MITNDLAILIVDDTDSGLQMFASALKSAGYEDIRLASTGREVLDELVERHADVVVADWIMPEMDGLELTNQIRQQDEDNNRYTSIILCTAKEGIDNLVHAFEQGVDDFLSKPINIRELSARVQAAGRVSSLQNTLYEITREMQATNLALTELAQTDPLTQLGNRRYMQSHLEATLKESSSRGGGTCCAIIDIDHFKKVNDEHGHPVGDEILVAVSKRLRRAVRPTDILARIGGEEFAIIMYYQDDSNFRHSIFSRIQKSVGTRPIKTSAGEITVTISMGVCCRFAGDPEMDMDMLMRCADQKMYRAKKKGRDQVIY
ncbi:MAG TPA: diguanylate cyclase [Gammaproteobacteria bacterium]|nr:diguanylate cyclase [Gammaproteobacteria bacterium]